MIRFSGGTLSLYVRVSVQGATKTFGSSIFTSYWKPSSVRVQAFDGMKRVGMFKSAYFGFVVVSDGIDDQRVAFPSSDRVAQPRRIRIGLMRFAIERNNAESSGIFMHQDKGVLVLNDLKLIRHPERVRRTERHAIRSSSDILRSAIDLVLLRAGFQLGTATRAAAGSTRHRRRTRKRPKSRVCRPQFAGSLC